MRSIWRGALSFGLVHIPIRMYSASKSRELKFKMLHKKDMSEIRYARICKADGKEIPWEDIVKGYEYEKGDYIVLSEEDFEKANLKKTSTIEILDFTNEDQIDPIYYDTPYYLEPEKGAEQAYELLYEALKKSKKIAVGRFVFHHHEHIGIVRVYKDILILQQLRYKSELISSKELNIPQPKVAHTELEMALKFIEELSKPFKAEQYSDTYEDEIKQLIVRKAKGKKIHVTTEELPSPKIHNILDLLKESLKKQAPKKAHKPKKKRERKTA